MGGGRGVRRGEARLRHSGEVGAAVAAFDREARMRWEQALFAERGHGAGLVDDHVGLAGIAAIVDAA